MLTGKIILAYRPSCSSTKMPEEPALETHHVAEKENIDKEMAM
jgi:hypothetical protein